MWLLLNHKPTASSCAIMSLAVNADDAVHITQDPSRNTGFILNFFPIGRCIHINSCFSPTVIASYPLRKR